MNVHTSAATDAILIEKDVEVPMRDGARLMADVFRPQGSRARAGAAQSRALPEGQALGHAGYAGGKAQPLHELGDRQSAVVGAARLCRRARRRARQRQVARPACEPWSLAEAVDFYDAIEWAAAQPWCNGKVGLIGISYYAMNQWFVANLAPPSLKAIIPWEGAADLYRDALYHGGILSVFMTNWFTAHLMHHTLGRASRVEPDRWKTDTMYRWLHDSLDSGALRGAQAQWDKITLPMFTAGNWSGMALHLRGNTEAFMRAASKHKKLRIHAGSHVHAFYTEEGRADQLRFFDYWLKGIDNGVMDEPPVKLAIRKGNDELEWRHEHEWPLTRTQWTKFYFDLSQSPPAGKPQTGILAKDNPKTESSCTYPVFSLGTMGSTSAASSQVMGGGGIKPGMGVALQTPPLPHDIEVTGPLMASFWVSSESEDMDLFLTLRNFDARRERDFGNRSARRAGAGGEGLAARLAPRARSRADAALSALSQASAAALSQARRDRAGAGRNLADLDGVQKGPPHPARRAAARRRRQRRLSALSRRLQHRHEHHLCRRRA